MKIRLSAFIVTKPFQYINATNISDSNFRDLYLISSFNNFEKFYQAVKNKSNFWNKIYIFNSKEISILKLLLKQRRYEKLYLDSDFGLLLRFLLFFFINVKIFVYEEGIASYTYNLRGDITLKSKFRTFLDKLLLGYTWSGSSYKTSGIYLYQKAVFLKLLNYKIRNKTILPFNKSYIAHLSNISEIDFLYENINFNLYSGKDVLLYLTAGDINNEIYTTLALYPNFYKILKLHPFQKNTDYKNFDESIDNSLPAELLISKLKSYANTLIVIHESSAAILNIINDIELIEINIGEKAYAQNFDYLKSLFIVKQ
jgi:hypothetical protein